MTMLVPTELAPSSIHGIGVFALRDINRGEVVWEFHHPFDQQFFGMYIQSLGRHGIAYVMEHAHYEASSKSWLMSADNARFINHHPKPNLSHTTRTAWARHDIKKGDELTCQYLQCDDNAERYPFVEHYTDNDQQQLDLIA